MGVTLRRLAAAASLTTLLSRPLGAHTLAFVDAGRGPVTVMVPDGYSPKRAVPLVVSLHGYGGRGDAYVRYWTRNGQVDKRDFIVVAPPGETDSKGRAYWNATEACCDKDDQKVDDTGYLRRLIDVVEAAYTIDPKSIHITGYSNGGFMAHRMACEYADKLASISSVAGAGPSDAERCAPTAPINVLQVHGLEDRVIQYVGGELRNRAGATRAAYPGAEATVAAWAKRNGAQPSPLAGVTRDFSDRATGDDTRTTQYVGDGASVELWAIAGEGHVPRLSGAFHEALVEWMLTHRKTSD